MIDMITAYSYEIDDVDVAVMGLLSQLDMDIKLRKNAAGIVHCPYEFIEAGVTEALQSKLPFPLVGSVTVSNSVNGAIRERQLSVCVLTSDDVEFVARAIDISGLDDELLDEEKYMFLDDRDDDPSLILMWVPINVHSQGKGIRLYEKFSKALTKTPIFGGMPVTNEINMQKAVNIHMGRPEKNSLVTLSLYGDVDLEFFQIDPEDLEDHYLSLDAIVTDADGVLIKAINEMNAVECLKHIGLVSDENIAGIESTPFVVRKGKSQAKLNICHYATPEGYLSMGGTVEEGSTLDLCVLTKAKILEGTAKIMSWVKSSERRNRLMLYSGISRNWLLGMDNVREIKIVNSNMTNDCPFIFAYSYSIFVPRRASDGNWENAQQNGVIAMLSM